MSTRETHAPDPFAGRRCLVLGATGFIGRWVAVALAEQGARVVVQARDASRLSPDVAELAGDVLVADLTADDAARTLLADADPELVFDLSGYGVAKSERDDAGYRTVNVEFPASLAAGLAALGRSVVAVRLGSALEVGPGATSLDEAAPCRPTTEYGRSKLAATLAFQAARDEGAACLTARAFTVFGPGERPGRLVPTLLQASRGQGRIPLSEGSQRRDWTYVEDVADGLVRLSCASPDDIVAKVPPFDAPCINLASGALHSVRSFVETFAEEFGIAQERLGFGDVEGLPEEMPHPPVPIDRLVAAVGWSPPPTPRPGIRRLRSRMTEEISA